MMAQASSFLERFTNHARQYEIETRDHKIDISDRLVKNDKGSEHPLNNHLLSVNNGYE